MTPEVVNHTIPKIETFQVVSYELDQIEDLCGKPERYSVTCATSFTSFVSLGIAWASLDKQIASVFGVLAIVCAIAAVITGFMWFRIRKSRTEVVQRIRNRRVDPGSAEQAERPSTGTGTP